MSNSTNYVDMGDDAFEAMVLSGSEHKATPFGGSVEVDADLEVDSNDGSTEGDELSVDDQTGNVADEQSTEAETEDEGEEAPTQSDELAEESDAETSETEADVLTSDAQLADLFSTFKADGSEMSVKSVAEARQLMQQGVAFNNRMAAFKPHRKTIKTLANNDIDEEKLNYLIDLSKGTPEAIAKLIKDSGYDVHRDESEDPSYSPNNYSVSDNVVDLDDAIARMQTTDSFSTTSDIVTNQWDEVSKQALFADPQKLEDLNTHVANGTYARVKQEVTRQQAFGKLQGLSSLDAYYKVGMEMQQAGAFNVQAEAPKVVTTAPKADPVKTAKKRSASPTKQTSTSTSHKVNDFTQMNDDDFEKYLSNK